METLISRLAVLESRLAKPEEIGNYSDLPFAIFWYPPDKEWHIRDEIRRLAIRVREMTGREVIPISLAELLWQAIEETVGNDELAEVERTEGFTCVQETVYSILTTIKPLPEMIADQITDLQPDKSIVFLTRAAAFAPTIYPMSVLLDQLKVLGIRIPTVLFYPGRHVDRTTLIYMDLPHREATGNYFVPIY